MPLEAGSGRGVVGNNIREMLAAGHPRAQAIAAALSNAGRHPHANGGIVGYDAGGAMMPQNMGIAPNTQTQNPAEQQAISQLSNLPNEKLQEVAMQLGGTGQGQVAQKLLMQRRMMPNAAPQTGIGGAPQQQPMQPPQRRRGGNIRHYADGGDLSWEQGASLAHHASQATTGFLHSIVPGRTDLIHANPPTGSFVIPADVVSGLGEGNSLAGAHILQMALATGPHGIPQSPKAGGGVGIPKAPPVFSGSFMAPAAKRGGRQGNQDIGKPTPILAAGGEVIVPPHIVALWGHGDLKKAHDVLDEWVVRKRKAIAHKMLKLPGPKKS